MQGWLWGSSCCDRGVEKVGTTLDKVCLSGHSKEGGSMLLSAWIIAFERSGDEVIFNRSGRGWLTRRLTYSLWTGMVFAIGVVTEARVLEGVFAFRGVDIRLR